MLHHADKRCAHRGFTLIEVLIGLTLSVLVVGSVIQTFVTTARAMSAVGEQTRRQSAASVALDRCAEILRNARYPVTITSPTDIRFIDVRNPGETARIWLNGTDLMYDTDINDGTAGRALSRGISGFTIGPDPDPLIGNSVLQIQISYTYQGFRDYFPNETRNATFVTAVYLRNNL